MSNLASLLLVLIVTCCIVDATSVQPLFVTNCTQSGSFTQDSKYQFIFNDLLGSFTSQALKTQFYNSTLGQAPNRMYGLYLCRGDVVGQNCRDCVSAAINMILQYCPYRLRAIIWFNYCLVRYSPDPFFGKLSVDAYKYYWSSQNITGNTTEFENIMRSTMLGLVNEIKMRGASSSRMMYVTKEVTVTQSLSLYAMQQCTNDLTKSDCLVCLRFAIQLLKIQSQGSTVYSPSCFLRYDTNPFFSLSASVTSAAAIHVNGTPRSQPQPHPHPAKLRDLLLGSISIVVSIACLGTIIVIWIRKKKKKAVKTSLLGEMHDITTVESLQFDWNAIKIATRNFCMDNKLGEGGFGEVYEGVLENGQEVAVKRLSKNSGQGIAEFNTEMVIVAKLQHKNLVKLLGFCLAPNEKNTCL